MRNLTIATILFCAATLSAAPRTFVSAAAGNDINPCSRALPCRSFTAALALTDGGGEIVALDSGGYGAVNISQSVALISPEGVHAGITAQGTDGISITGGALNVVLKNLMLSYWYQIGVDTAGIRDTAGGSLNVEGCTITGFASGIYFAPTLSGARLYVMDSIIQRGYSFTHYGIEIHTPNLAGRAMIDSTQFYDAEQPIYLQNAQATVRDCIATTGEDGYEADFQSGMVVTRSVAKDFAYGFFANNSSTIVVNRCLATRSSIYGVAAFNSCNAYVSGSSLVDNAQAAFGSATGAARTRGNNTVQGNTNNGVFTIGFFTH